ncbi:Flp family type IVb pilin [Gottfriedia sp. NPDC058432]|uniref:Flp family type IVb pilin n=1 Tax=Gottfriedia sp. NPDC058432 TaxID=3346497 RepID=UPI00364F1E4E
MLNKFKNLVVAEEGQGLSEYGLLIAGVVGVVAAAVLVLQATLGDAKTGLFKKVSDAIDNALGH